MNLLAKVYQIFWSEWFWLPAGVTWDDMKPRQGFSPSVPRYIFLIIPIAIGYLILKSLLSSYVLKPIGKHFGIKSKHSRIVKPNPVLEAAYQANKKFNPKNIIGLQKQSELSEREIERWWRIRTAQDTATVLDKFCETAFQLIYYIISFTVGVYILHDKPYIYDFHLFIKDHPFQSITTGNHVYILMTQAYYLALTISHFRDARRKDFWQMLFHHVNAVFLYGLNYASNHVYQTCFVTLLHDTGDIVLYATKVLKYLKMNTAAMYSFFLFFLTLLITRIGLYGSLLYYYVTFPHKSYYTVGLIILFFLILLYFLHCYWAYLSARIIYIAFTVKEVEKQQDIRSDASSGSEYDDETQETKSDKIKINDNIKINDRKDDGNDDKVKDE